jgi:AAA family ATP:ADP antiporter
MSFSARRLFGGGPGPAGEASLGGVEGDKYDADDEDAETAGGAADYVDRAGPFSFQELLMPAFRLLYGDLPLEEIRRILSLSATLFFMIGGYWLLRSLKDPVLTAICGVAAIPKAKMMSVGVVLGVVYIYNK